MIDNRIKQVFIFPNGMVAVCDAAEQLYEYQGRWEEVKDRLLQAAPPGANILCNYPPAMDAVVHRHCATNPPTLVLNQPQQPPPAYAPQPDPSNLEAEVARLTAALEDIAAFGGGDSDQSKLARMALDRET